MKTVEKEIKSGSDVFLVPMEVPVCSSCGERYYDSDAMKKIQDPNEQPAASIFPAVNRPIRLVFRRIDRINGRENP